MSETLNHIAIIMDGNGRWATKRRLPKIMGHKKGVETVDRIIEACAKKEIGVLTLYTFSTENWKRSEKEVNALMTLLDKQIDNNYEKIMNNNIKFRVVGDIDGLPEKLRIKLEKLILDSSENSGMILSLALNYGSRQEILHAVKNMCRKVLDGQITPDSIEEKDFSELLYTKDIPDPDLIVRTSGEMRLSNFLLWQAAYSELYVTKTLWPDFTVDELDLAIEDYFSRNRRFGG